MIRLNSERLILKNVSLSDADNCQKHFTNERVTEWLDNIPAPYPENGAFSFISRILKKNDPNEIYLGIFLKDKPNELIGTVHSTLYGKTAHRGFWLDPNAWGKGIMTEATIACARYIFQKRDVKIIEAQNYIKNRASARIKEKTGFRFIEEREVEFRGNRHIKQFWELSDSDFFTKLNESCGQVHPI